MNSRRPGMPARRHRGKPSGNGKTGVAGVALAALALFLAVATALAAVVVVLSADAKALGLTNRDAVELRIQVSEGAGGPAQTQVVRPGQTLLVPCAEGCTISLENGVEEAFAGDELVDIEDELFVIAE